MSVFDSIAIDLVSLPTPHPANLQLKHAVLWVETN